MLALAALATSSVFCSRGSNQLGPQPRGQPHLGRRAAVGTFFGLSAAVGSPTTTSAAQLEPSAFAAGDTLPEAGRAFFETILPPVRSRATVRTAIGRDGEGMWSFEQLLVFQNVSATIRMTVVRLADGNLWVHAPVAPTGECLALLAELGGAVSHIVLPVTALEHKAFFGPFVRQFPKAKTWVAPGQYGPFGALTKRTDEVTGATVGYDNSLPYRVDGVLGEPGTCAWGEELPYKLLYVDLPGNAGPVTEAAFLHRPSRTLVVTDAVVFIPPKPPPTSSALFAGYFGEGAASQADFWPKSVLQAVFLPLRQADDGSWPGYERITGRVLRAPILRAFGDVRAPDQIRDWVSSISDGDWQFDRIVSAHFAAPIGSTSPKEFRAAFGRLYGSDQALTLDPADWSTLDGLNAFIETNKLGAPLLADYK